MLHCLEMVHFHNPGEISLSHNGVLFLDELPEIKTGHLAEAIQYKSFDWENWTKIIWHD